jgi:hypothetical protein
VALATMVASSRRADWRPVTGAGAPGVRTGAIGGG